MFDLQHHMTAFGPLAILLGAAFEGQTVVIGGGVMARQHLISPAMAVGAAALGSGVIDYLLFVLGRWLNKQAGGGDILWQKGKNA